MSLPQQLNGQTAAQLKRMTLARVSGRSICAGLIFDGPWCVEAAPIFWRWAHGRLWADIERECRRRRFKLELVSTWD